MRTLAACALLFAAACGGSSRSSTGPAAATRSCADAGGRVADLMMAQGLDGASEFGGAVTTSCEEDAWPAAATACFASLGDDGAPEDCEGTLDAAQQEALTERLLKAGGWEGGTEVGSPAPDDGLTGDACDGGE
jgi:hypothetical protein